MMRTSQLLLGNTDRHSSLFTDATLTTDATAFTGPPLRADLWYGSSTHLYTIAIHSNAFTGVVQIEGTVVANPQNTDWFSIGAPVKFDATTIQGAAAFGFSFGGLYTWIRATVAGTAGAIDRILINQ